MAVPTGAYAVSFGALSVAAGLSVWQTCALSALMFTGGSQFAFIGILGSGGSGLTAVTAATLLGARNGLYGLLVGQFLHHERGWRRLAAAHLTIDESTAVGIAQRDDDGARLGFWHTGIGIFLCWNACTLVGALAGGQVGDPRRWGLDGAAAAAFVALLWPRLRNRDAAATAAIAVLLTVLLAPRAPVGVPVLAAATAALVVGLAGRPGGRGAGGRGGRRGPGAS